MFSRYSQFFAHRTFASAAAAGKSVGFVGLGCMGVPMAGNLKKAGWDVKGYDIMPAARQAANDAGITTVDSLAEAASNVDYVVTALPKTEHVEEAVRGDGGIFQNAKQGTLICDVSTIDPEGSRRRAPNPVRQTAPSRRASSDPTQRHNPSGRGRRRRLGESRHLTEKHFIEVMLHQVIRPRGTGQTYLVRRVKKTY